VGSAGSLVCVYSLSESVCQIFGWNKSLATYFEWMSESKFLVAESSGMISLDSANQQKMKKVYLKLIHLISSLTIEEIYSRLIKLLMKVLKT